MYSNIWQSCQEINGKPRTQVAECFFPTTNVVHFTISVKKKFISCHISVLYNVINKEVALYVTCDPILEERLRIQILLGFASNFANSPTE